MCDGKNGLMNMQVLGKERLGKKGDHEREAGALEGGEEFATGHHVLCSTSEMKKWSLKPKNKAFFNARTDQHTGLRIQC
jgi:hypothetical protein